MEKKRKARGSTKDKIEYEVSSGNIFEDFGFENPKEANVKSDLALLIRGIIKKRKLTQEKAAKLMQIDQPKVSKIVRGLLSEFTIERLMNYLIALGCDLEIKPTIGKTATPSIHVTKNTSLKRLSA
ncbi:MAG: helix-turn-helix transcriptional regulator [Chlamydiales bacterium]|nr:helix-turn-helix transcriptional regulator [Chlamydiales bacterium]